MSEHDAFDRVLAAVHAATLDETRWPAASALIDKACGLTGNGLMVADGPANDVRALFVGLYYRGQRRADLEREYLTTYHPVRLEFPILSGESAPPVWRQPNVDHVGSWRATAPRRPAAPSRHVCSVRCSTATRYPPNARRTEAKCTRLSVLARQAAVAVERLAASGRLPVACIAVSARQTAASVAVGSARGDHWPDERVALPRVVVVYPRGAEPGLARPARRRRRCLQGRPPVGRAAAAGQPAGVLMASPRTVSGRASAERGRSQRAYCGGGCLTGCCRDYDRPHATRPGPPAVAAHHRQSGDPDRIPAARRAQRPAHGRPLGESDRHHRAPGISRSWQQNGRRTAQ